VALSSSISGEEGSFGCVEYGIVGSGDGIFVVRLNTRKTASGNTDRDYITTSFRTAGRMNG